MKAGPRQDAGPAGMEPTGPAPRAKGGAGGRIAGARVVAPADRWVAVPQTALDAPISDGAFRLYALLLSLGARDAVAYPGQKWLATTLHKSVRQVQYDLEELREAGLVDCHHRGFGQSNLYVLRSVAGPSRAAAAAAQRYEETQPVSLLDMQPVAELATQPLSPLLRGNDLEGSYVVSPPAPAPGPDDDDATLARLKTAGVHPTTARRLLRQHGAAACGQQLDWLPQRPVRADAAGYLVRAIEGSYLPPGGDPTVRLAKERPPAPLPPPPDLGPLPGPESDAAREAARDTLVAKGKVALAPRLDAVRDAVGAIGGPPARAGTTEWWRDGG